MSILTIDLDTAEEIDVLYAIAKAAELLRDPNPVMNALSKVAADIADTSNPRTSYSRLFELADELYPQTAEIWTAEDRHRLASIRDAHLRRFGMLVERRAAA